MNTVKKIIAVITVMFVVIRLFMISVSASFAAPAMAAEEITALLETALVGSGLYTESELEGKSYFELNDLLKDGINSGQINPKTNYYTDPISKVQYNLLDLLSKPEAQVGIGFINGTVSSVTDNAVGEFLSKREQVGYDWYNDVHPTYVDPPEMVSGGTAGILIHYRQGVLTWVNGYTLCDYGEVFAHADGSYSYKIQNNTMISQYSQNNTDNKAGYTYYYDVPSNAAVSYNLKDAYVTAIQIYGDWRLEDGSPAETDDGTVPVIGEVAGTQVTPDMLNPDGTVTIDGTTYSPSDFIDWDKFKDNAIIDLLNDILSKIDDMPVAEPDTTKDLVDSITDSVSVPDELSDYIMPVGISTVFPFCLPFDLYRGVKLLNAPPVAPVLKIPFNIPEFGLFKGYKTELVIEFAKYDKYFSVFRWGIYFIFALSLIFISTKIVKGAGA